MDYRDLWYEENTAITERYDLAVERIAQFAAESRVAEPFRDYFIHMAQFSAQIDELFGFQMRGELADRTLDELQALNEALYADVLPGHYAVSYANPDYAAARLGSRLGSLLSAFYAQMRGAIVFAFESRLTDITILWETLIEIYNLFEEGTPRPRQVREVLYWFFSDYSDVTLTYRVREQLDPSLSFARDIILHSDLDDLRYLYRFGEYISDTELQLAAFMNTLPQETIDRMAAAYTQGYQRGFVVMRRDLSKKKTVAIRYELGFERMIRAAIHQFQAMGLSVILCRAAVWSVTQSPGRQAGWHASSPNRQYDFDHRYDSAIYLDKAFKERKLGVLRTAYEEYRRLAEVYAGPAVVETFGRAPFSPKTCAAARRFTRKQEELSAAYTSESMQVINRYVPGDETSFTIIAFPLPEIGRRFPEIFAETIRINTLDYEIYRDIQQRLIDVLDEAESIHVTGREGNETDILVRLHTLTDVSRQTNFENCVADVNIPLGEVFTSPLLAGTNGLLHVGKVYLGSIQFINLRLRFENGMVTDYSCDNSADPAKGRELIRQEILKNHDTLPLGEFAIGTNTTAYAMAGRFGIIEKLPILIAEKMGPHFAVGDTCYSWSEDSPMYNPDGREVIARDNEISLLRREDPAKAYFGCHTDITIPYAELGDITAVCADGRRLPVIREGRFVAPGTGELNEALNEALDETSDEASREIKSKLQ
ncbi:MAG: aminopeptidase [Clostridiales bacterium]|nr:aminopeptidase [Clostridiales bacterium]